MKRYNTVHCSVQSALNCSIQKKEIDQQKHILFFKYFRVKVSQFFCNYIFLYLQTKHFSF